MAAALLLLATPWWVVSAAAQDGQPVAVDAGPAFDAPPPADEAPEGDATETAAGEDAEAPEAPLVASARRLVTEVQVLCPDPRCAPDRALHRRLLAVVAVAPGDTVSRADLARIRHQLAGIGLFRAVEVRVETDPAREGAILVVELVPQVLVRRVQVRGSTALADEVRRRLLLRAGQPWDPDAPAVARQEQVLRAFFERRGWFDPEITLEVVEVTPWLVDLVLRIDPGRRLRVDRIHVRGHEHFDYGTLRDIILGEFTFLQAFSADRFIRAQEAVLRRYRDEGFLQARIVGQGFRLNRAAGTADLFLDLREGERWRVRFTGNEALRRRELLTGLSFYESGIIDDEELRAAVREIQARYAAAGHLFADVRVEQRRDDDGVRELRFTIVENARAELLSIGFEGLTALSAAEVRAEWETSTYGIFSPGGYLQWSLLERDLRTLERLLLERGHLGARVERVVVVAERGGREAHLRVFVHEGPQTRVGSVAVTGLAAEERERVLRELALRPGEPFGPSRLSEDQTRLRAMRIDGRSAVLEVDSACVGADGVEVPCLPAPLPAECRFTLTTQRDEACARTEPDATGRFVQECRLQRVAPACLPSHGANGDAVDLRHALVVGPPTTFGEVFVRGAEATRARVVRRELPFEPGEPFDLALLLRGQSNLRSLGLFNAVRMVTVGLDAGADLTGEAPLDPSGDTPGEEPELPADVPVVVSVQLEETSYRSIDYRVGLEGRVAALADMLVLQTNELTWRDINLLGTATELRLVGELDVDIVTPSRIRQDEFDAALRIISIDPRARLLGRARRPWETRSELFWEYDLLAPAPTPQQRTIGLDLRARQEFERRSGLFFQLGFNVRRVDTRDQSEQRLVDEGFERALILSLIPRFTLEKRDNPLNPTRGFFGEASLELADDFLGLLDSRQYTKLSVRSSQFTPLGGQGLVLGVGSRLGLATGGLTGGLRPARGGFSLPLSERFRLGGVNSLRGFGEGAIRAPGATAFGGDVLVAGNLELRYPFLPHLGLNGAMFLDVGQLGRSFGDIHPSELRWASGVGIRWLIADLIPLVLDYGLALDRRPGEGSGRLHFNIGYTF